MTSIDATHWILACVVMPHGATDIVVSYVSCSADALCRSYISGVCICVVCWMMHEKLHFLPFLLATWMHFVSDVRVASAAAAAGGHRKTIAVALGLSGLIGLAFIHYNVARWIMLLYMLVIHIPLHYCNVRKRLRHAYFAQLLAVILVVLFGAWGLYGGARWLSQIESEQAVQVDGAMVAGIVVGHVLYSDSVRRTSVYVDHDPNV